MWQAVHSRAGITYVVVMCSVSPSLTLSLCFILFFFARSFSSDSIDGRPPVKHHVVAVAFENRSTVSLPLGLGTHLPAARITILYSRFISELVILFFSDFIAILNFISNFFFWLQRCCCCVGADDDAGLTPSADCSVFFFFCKRENTYQISTAIVAWTAAVNCARCYRRNGGECRQCTLKNE